MSHLLDGVLAAVSRHPQRPAVCQRGCTLTYEELIRQARRIARALRAPEREPPLGAVLASRGPRAYAAILGTLWSGRGYVPLSPASPVRRTASLLRRSGADVLVVAEPGYARLAELLALVDTPLSVVHLDGPDAVDLAHGPLARGPQTPGDVAYLMFTSGTTGEPKGVPVRHESVVAYLDAVLARHALRPSDRTSQLFDLTFDLSVHDMFATWQAGACLYPVPEAALVAPASFIRREQLTSWFCVPSLAARMDQLQLLRDGAFPSLRLSLFCGEPLMAAVAARWRGAAPGSTVDNLYGPTEATIAITAFEVPPDLEPTGIVPIGWPLPGQRCAVMDDAGAPVPSGVTGELWLSGPQVATGYWRDSQQTARRFAGSWYRTGDLVRADARGCLAYLGRDDEQVKVRGYRVELLEVDQALRSACGTNDAMALAWPGPERAEDLVAVVSRDCTVSAADILARCREVLADYMCPHRVVVLPEMPRNTNGKLDRQRLAAIVGRGA